MTHLTLTTNSQIAAYLHRSRMDILAALRSAPMTVSQIAAKLKGPAWLEQGNAAAMVTPDAKWQPIAGSMGGVQVGALLSYGF